ncbi:hypothetical protein Cyrtocomes_00615 [Candidatus Cyrtobacter comes]|uniref:Uncharacterized protein n=1 Tax=Candidatus Cyrtobacter comes TaxID=675776 RepID=A0ABU5L7Z5_9RICK|nr:hypothetical protein [Candidatus Cyrtobacter comes]MDZ5762240.1 hypothetical protein [Candidatus Cyrtobacter comes]
MGDNNEKQGKWVRGFIVYWQENCSKNSAVKEVAFLSVSDLFGASSFFPLEFDLEFSKRGDHYSKKAVCLALDLVSEKTMTSGNVFKYAHSYDVLNSGDEISMELAANLMDCSYFGECGGVQI